MLGKPLDDAVLPRFPILVSHCSSEAGLAGESAGRKRRLAAEAFPEVTELLLHRLLDLEEGAEFVGVGEPLEDLLERRLEGGVLRVLGEEGLEVVLCLRQADVGGDDVLRGA